MKKKTILIITVATLAIGGIVGLHCTGDCPMKAIHSSVGK